MNFNNTLINETRANLTQNYSNKQLSSNNNSAKVLKTDTPSNTTNQSSSQSSANDPIGVDSNVIEPSISVNNVDESTTTTTTSLPSTMNNNEAMPSIISSPWLKGMLVNAKSLPELFKIIEKLNFNLTLSNRYLQELSQHYVYVFNHNPYRLLSIFI